MPDLGLRIILIVHAIQDNGRSHGQKKLPHSGSIYELKQIRRNMSNEEINNMREINLLKEAFALSIDQKQGLLIRLKLEADMKGYHRISNGKILEGGRNNLLTKEQLEEHIVFLKECYDRAEELRVKISDKRVERQVGAYE